MSAMASQITSHTIVCSIVYSGADQRKHQSSASLAFVRGIHRWPANSPHKGPVTRKMFPFDDVFMQNLTDDKSTLLQLMTWYRQSASHYLNQCWPRFMSPNGVTWPQYNVVRSPKTYSNQISLCNFENSKSKLLAITASDNRVQSSSVSESGSGIYVFGIINPALHIIVTS